MLHDLSAPHHGRNKGRKSLRHQDLCELASLMNHGLEFDEHIHWCWDDATGKPCCKDEAATIQRVTVAIVHAFLLPGDPLPAESRWTHVLTSFITTLTRKVAGGFGIDCFDPDLTSEELKQLDIDCEGMDDYFKNVLKVRAKRTKEYYDSKRNFWELGVFVCILQVADSRLLYPLLGDPIRSDPKAPSKLDQLLDPDESLVGLCFQELLHLACDLEGWVTITKTLDCPRSSSSTL